LLPGRWLFIEVKVDGRLAEAIELCDAAVEA
jgi:hypothetical protein